MKDHRLLRYAQRPRQRVLIAGIFENTCRVNFSGIGEKKSGPLVAGPIYGD
jgi:hypothetical protein